MQTLLSNPSNLFFNVIVGQLWSVAILPLLCSLTGYFSLLLHAQIISLLCSKGVTVMNHYGHLKANIYSGYIEA